MSPKALIESFVVLGDFLRQFPQKQENPGLAKLNQTHFKAFQQAIVSAGHHNQWFTEEMVLESLSGIAGMLDKKTLTGWLAPYPFDNNNQPKKVAVIMAGNIPLVGFHDMLSVLVTGNHLTAKMSSKDAVLPKAVCKVLTEINPEFNHKITLTEEQISGFDAVIATGSDNTSRYFDYYFGKYPNIIRKNRNSAIIFTGNESTADFQNMGKDIFLYFGLGCRNVSKLYVPKNYDFTSFFKAIEYWKPVGNHNKYANNYEYQKTLLLMNQIPHLDNGFVLLKEDGALSSPIAVLHVEYYREIEQLADHLAEKKEEIQCLVCKETLEKASISVIPPGKTQYPAPWDYADNIDTIDFLLNLT